MFKYKRFGTGEYKQWLEFIDSSRAGRNRDDEFDIVEGPYRTKASNGTFTEPEGHQLGILSTVAAKYFDDHVKPRAAETSSSLDMPNDSVLRLLSRLQRLELN